MNKRTFTYIYISIGWNQTEGCRISRPGDARETQNVIRLDALGFACVVRLDKALQILLVDIDRRVQPRPSRQLLHQQLLLELLSDAVLLLRDAGELVLLASEEQGVVEALLIARVPGLREVVHV